MSKPVDQERELFEAWYARKVGVSRARVEGWRVGDTYGEWYAGAVSAWEVWQARASVHPTPSPASPWIKCSERLPGDDLDGMAVIVATVHFKRGAISESDVWRKASGRTGGRFEFWGRNVTHWMPLPDAPAMSGGGV